MNDLTPVSQALNEPFEINFGGDIGVKTVQPLKFKHYRQGVRQLFAAGNDSEKQADAIEMLSMTIAKVAFPGKDEAWINENVNIMPVILKIGSLMGGDVAKKKE